MISRLVAIAALAGATLAGLPVLAQTGMTPQTGTPDTVMGAGTATPGAAAVPAPEPTTSQAQAAPHARHVRHMADSDAAERRVTECLNSAAAQQSPLDTCRR